MATDLLTTLTKVNKPLFGVLGLFFLCQPAFAHKLLCAPHDALVKANDQLGFILHSSGVADNGFLAESFVDPETGKWIWISTDPNNSISCIINAGEGWRKSKPKTAEQKS